MVCCDDKVEPGFVVETVIEIVTGVAVDRVRDAENG